ncbi:16S rRNA (uracil(1498)-N(3))-methyltransferase [Xylanibacter muris]|uniref:Ribosomal RNA small subunit methyltransferase E n=1 Tax=Xylanibacter muris TaxID=2736290 RepID=A0ABX2APR7_9BACT|nr:16S rRNA (uracil(1498)-N(3))-methyltransferase [Xylanibacter muris]NPD92204.1 16S rRNA (uracil(1498)-N(3))-methyltransferase [Xylanibacter muris]
MKETRFFYVPDADILSELPEDEARHALRVLRLAAGDEIMLMDGKGSFYKAEVTVASSHKCMYKINDVCSQKPQWCGHFHIAMAPTKMMDRVEWMVEKATEIGVDEFSFLNCSFSERKVIKTERIEKIVVSAVKQSRKAWKPVVNPIVSFDRFIAVPPKGRKYIAHCYDEIEKTELFDELKRKVCCGGDATDVNMHDVTVLIGPEGDFSIDEVRAAVAAGFISVSLGKSRLRTETAALAAVMMMQLASRE